MDRRSKNRHREHDLIDTGQTNLALQPNMTFHRCKNCDWIGWVMPIKENI